MNRPAVGALRVGGAPAARLCAAAVSGAAKGSRRRCRAAAPALAPRAGRVRFLQRALAIHAAALAAAGSIPQTARRGHRKKFKL